MGRVREGSVWGGWTLGRAGFPTASLPLVDRTTLGRPREQKLGGLVGLARGKRPAQGGWGFLCPRGN